MQITVQGAPAVPTDLAYTGPSASTSRVVAETSQSVPRQTDTEEFAPNGPIVSIAPASTAIPPLGASSQLATPQPTPLRIPTTIPAPAAAPVSYVIAQPSVVTLQIIDGKLVTATEASTQYSIALPTASGLPLASIPPVGPGSLKAAVQPLTGSSQNISQSPPASEETYLNPLIQYSSQIIAAIPSSCTRPCTSFLTHYTTCTSRHAPVFLSSAPPTPEETQSNIALSECLCDYTYQAQTCGQCFVRDPTMGPGKVEWFQGVVGVCQAMGQGKTESLVSRSFRMPWECVCVCADFWRVGGDGECAGACGWVGHSRDGDCGCCRQDGNKANE